jgi:hypothetical protein
MDMLRFHCPSCGKKMKAPERLAGKKVACPGCGEPAVAPDAASEPPARGTDQPPGFLSALSPGLRLALGALATAGLLGLLAVVFGETWVARCGMAVACCSVLAVLAVLHGRGTGCPCCGAFWSRRAVRSEVGEREVVEHDGQTFRKSTTRREYRCDRCGHAWWAVDSEEYPVRQAGPQRRLRGG